MDIPKNLYKYEPFTELTLSNLKRQSLYFSSPKNFNDPYDCAITAEIQELSNEQLEILKGYFLNREETPAAMKEELARLNNQKLREKLNRIVSNVIDTEKNNFISECGITCFSESKDDLLMWSHYGGRYKGFCLEFNTQYEPFTKAKKVEYLEHMPKINPLPFIMNEIDNQFFSLFCSKSKSWAYEKEWRIFHKQAGTLYTYLPEALTAIYFGPDIEQECLEIIALIIGGQNPSVELYRGTRSNELFKVKFEKVNYTPYIVAKKLGLRYPLCTGAIELTAAHSHASVSADAPPCAPASQMP
ncbi:MAG: DUF2971 domain-containing protein [Lewinellaceae bacterium]|jgi:hypothetical protein|nr:DUF2971 domain-containing protein [Lewinellaceae bacterium]